MTLLPAPACAAHWAITYAWSGKTTLIGGGTTFASADWDPNNGPAFVSDLGIPVTRTMEAKGTVTATAVWTHDNGDTDPTPPNVIVYETGSAFWQGTNNGPGTTITSTGSAADGVPGDTEVKTTANRISQGVCSTTKIAYPSYPGGTVTLPKRTIDVQVTLTDTDNASSGQVSVSCSYSVAIHPQPYNFRQVGDPIDSGNGSVTFNYAWSSTSGTLSDISNNTCAVYEVVTYPGTKGTFSAPVAYVPPNPPFGPGWAYDANGQPNFPNPTINASQASSGSGHDIQTCFNSWTMPYSNATPWTATQNWYFDDSATGQSQALMPGSVANPLSITRSVGSRLMYTPSYWYSVTKGSFTGGWVALPGQ